jgi:NAD(P)-dependent dehydrogenase (short-subunit alcohol dehydrogenase family)
MTLAGRVALVTGASQGIGRACALKLAQSGATVALAARSQEKLQELAAEIAAAGGNANSFPLDVSDEEQIKATFKAAISQLGKIDILVNNAGITRDQLVMRMNARRLGCCPQHQPDLGVSLHPAGCQFDAQAALGQDHQHHFDFRADGPGRAGQLRRVKSRA